MTNDFAVIKLNSRQYIAKVGSLIKVDALSDKPAFDVLLAEVSGEVYIGEPTVESIGVKIQITDDKKDKKVEVRRFKSKSRYRKNKGHRQPISILRVLEIGEKTKNEIFRSDVKSDIKKEPKTPKNVQKSTSVSVDDLDITDKQKETLKSAGYKTADDIKSSSKEDLMNLKGLGEKSVLKLLEIVN